jgi:hypothetical protein
MASLPVEHRPRIDGPLPGHDSCERYQICINAQPSVVYPCLLRSDFRKLWSVRLLMNIRGGKRLRSNARPSDLRQRLVILTDLLEDELVIGVAGRFWCSDGGRFELVNVNCIV